MKILFYFVLSITISNCSSQSNEKVLEISYNAQTRGSFLKIRATEKRIIFEDNDSKKELELDLEKWNLLQKRCYEIPLNKLDALKVPSEQRSTDRALHAHLSIKTKEKKYISTTFDHGNPPKELKKIIAKLFELAEIKS